MGLSEIRFGLAQILGLARHPEPQLFGPGVRPGSCEDLPDPRPRSPGSRIPGEFAPPGPRRACRACPGLFGLPAFGDFPVSSPLSRDPGRRRRVGTRLPAPPTRLRLRRPCAHCARQPRISRDFAEGCADGLTPRKALRMISARSIASKSAASASLRARALARSALATESPATSTTVLRGAASVRRLWVCRDSSVPTRLSAASAGRLPLGSTPRQTLSEEIRMPSRSIKERLNAGQILILDGATGSELHRPNPECDHERK